MIGLVGLTVVFFGLVQIAMLGNQNIRALLDARREADGAMLREGVTVNDYVQDWTDGADALRYTADDVARRAGGGTGVFVAEVEAPLSLALLEQEPALGLQHALTPWMAGGNLATAADLRQGVGSAELEIENALRVLLPVSTTRIRVTEKAVMPGIRISDETTQTP